MTFETIFFVLSILGIADAGYIAYKHTRKQPLMCPIGDNCSVVTESRWSHMFGVRTEVLGLLYYATLFLGGLSMFLMPDYRREIILFFVWATGAGVLFSVFLVSLQAFVIRTYCFYCLMSALISILLLLTSLRLVS